MRKVGPIGPVFRRVLDCFDSKAEFARQVGTDSGRQQVNRWLQLGYIPLKWAVTASQATGNKVSPLEIINESTRIMHRKSIERETLRKAMITAAPEGSQA